MYLNCHTYYSFKFGALSTEDLLAEAQSKGVSKFVLSDINNTSAILDFHRLAKKYNVQPVAGIDFRNGVQQKFIGIAKNHEGFFELNNFLSKCLHEVKESMTARETEIPDLAPSFQNAFIVYPFKNVERNPVLHEHLIRDSTHSSSGKVGVGLSDLNRLRFSPWKYHPEKLVALAPVTFRNKTDFNTHRLLRAIDRNIVLSKLELHEQALPDEVMMSEEELCRYYKDFPHIISNTKKLLDECEPIDFEFGKNKNKKTFTGSAAGDSELLRKLCTDNLEYRYPKKEKHIIERFNHEIKMITELGFASYFLINWDIVRYAQHRNFFYIGRGSGANSMVAYLLHITDVDPVDLDLYFERFINAYRTSPPDFDIDFSWNDRDEVIEYIFKRNLTERTSLLATYSTFQSNSVVRELGKVFGLPKAEIDALQDPHLFPVAKDHITKLIYQYARCIHDFPNHLSIHAGGILISEKPMAYYTASSNPPKGFPLTQFSMLEAEDVGLYKFDILSQRGLGKMKDAVNIIKENRPEAIFDIHDVKRFKQDEKVREHLQQAKLMGCFYVESPAMRMLLTKLKASNYLDLVAASSIIRPGVAQSGMMQEYIRRFHDHSNLKFVHPLMEELMKETFGVMVYQEDVIKVAHHFAGLTLAESDMLRRGMGGKYRGREEFQKVEKKFFSNCKEKGYEDAVTKEVWRQIESFAGYAFSKGHSASYAVESYQCMFLKVHYPLEFMVAVINNGGGFFRVEYYVHEAMMCGGIIHAPDVNKSDVETTIDVKNIYLGFNLIAESEKKLQQEIAEERKRNGEFASLENFMKRVSVSVDQLRILIRINAFRFTKRTKQQLLWDIHSILGHQKKSVARRELFEGENKKYLLPELFNDPFQDAKDEIEILGFPLCSPFELASPPPQGGIPRAQSWRELVSNVREHPLPFGERWRGAVEIVGYYVTYKPTRTKKGDFMMFGCFIDRDGFFFDTNHFPEAAKKFPFRGKGCYLVKGKVAEEFGFYSINVTEMHKINYVMYEEDAETLARSKPDPEIIPPVIKTSKQFQYQIAIVPPPHVCNEVMALKKKFHEQFNHYQAITLKPFITLCNFTLVELNEADLIKKIASICHQQFPFKIKLKNFKHNRRNSIFISIEKPDHLIDLVTLLNKELQLSSKESFFNYSPQLTIARDLEPEKLSKAIPLFQALEYENAFKTNSIVILRREIKTVKYELVKEFLLEGKLKPGVVR